MRGFSLCLLLIAGSYGLPQGYSRPNHGGNGCGGSGNCGGGGNGGHIGGGGRRPNHGGNGCGGGGNGNCGGGGNGGSGGRRPNHGGNGGGNSNQGNGGANAGFGNLPDGCRIEFQTVHSIEEIENEENVCTPYTVTIQQRKCSPYQDRECKNVPKQVCKTTFEEVCQNLWRDREETYTEDVCTTNNVRTCQQHWKTYPNGDKKWEDNPETCQDLPETKCAPVQKKRNKPEQYRDCKQVPNENCYTEQVEECYDVTKQRCRNVPVQVQKQKCEIVHTKTPQGKATQKAVRVCDNDIGGAANPDNDFEIIANIRNTKEESSKKDGSRIGFTFSE